MKELPLEDGKAFTGVDEILSYKGGVSLSGGIRLLFWFERHNPQLVLCTKDVPPMLELNILLSDGITSRYRYVFIDTPKSRHAMLIALNTKDFQHIFEMTNHVQLNGINFPRSADC